MTFVAVSYNIVSPTVAMPWWLRFPHCPPSYLDFTFRRSLLRRELEMLDADVVCLRGLESTWMEVLELDLARLGYEYINVDTPARIGGIAVVFRSDCFHLLRSDSLNFDAQRADQTPCSS